MNATIIKWVVQTSFVVVGVSSNCLTIVFLCILSMDVFNKSSYNEYKKTIVFNPLVDELSDGSDSTVK